MGCRAQSHRRAWGQLCFTPSTRKQVSRASLVNLELAYPRVLMQVLWSKQLQLFKTFLPLYRRFLCRWQKKYMSSHPRSQTETQGLRHKLAGHRGSGRSPCPLLPCTGGRTARQVRTGLPLVSAARGASCLWGEENKRNSFNHSSTDKNNKQHLRIHWGLTTAGTQRGKSTKTSQ